MPLHSRLGNKSETQSQKKKKKKDGYILKKRGNSMCEGSEVERSLVGNRVKACWLEPRKQGREEVDKETTGLLFGDHFEDFELYPKRNRMPLENLREMSNMIRLVFGEITLAVAGKGLEGRLRPTKGCREPKRLRGQDYTSLAGHDGSRL